MAKGIKRLLATAMENVKRDMEAPVDRMSAYSVGIAEEGYKGGYYDALSDVMLALNGVVPDRKSWWEKQDK